MNKQDAIEKADFTLAAHDLPTYTELLDRLEIIRDQVKPMPTAVEALIYEVLMRAGRVK